MVEPPTIPVAESRLVKLEKNNEFLEAIQAKNEEVEKLKGIFEDANDHAKTCKKSLEKAQDELHELIKSGPPKPDAQKRLPFAEDKSDSAPEAGASDGQPTAEQTSEAPAEAEITIPAEIDALDITDLQKRRLTEAGCQTLADVVDLGNKNWPKFPEGFKSLDGFGPRAAAKLWAQLPSTAPPAEKTEDAKTIRIKLLTFSGQSTNLIPGNEYDATEIGNGHAIVQLPNEEPVEFLPHEFEKMEPATVS